ncbi:MAG: pre-16S rRNA-processing nuclease YqgF [Candidatus Eremiobacteraeota bacterium]|nr:pre-16S rRNA-processing nuclease YqgF [Candidatus Eremiobacteraeota bacterium]
MEKEIIIAIDPGRQKCGLVVLGRDCDIMEKRVIPTGKIEKILDELIKKYQPDRVLMGSGTHGRKLKVEVESVLGGIPITLVDEKHSTEKGREKYLAVHPPRGFTRLIPRGMRLPPEPYDDYAALVLAEQYLAQKHSGTKKE